MKKPSELTNKDIGKILYNKDNIEFVFTGVNEYKYYLVVVVADKEINSAIYDIVDLERNFSLDKFKAKPIVDWSVISPWFKYVAMDLDGVWFMYTFEPTRGAVSFKSNGSDYTVIPREYAPKFNGDWKDSLVERPK